MILPQPQKSSCFRTRCGMTLLEIILSIAFLAGALVVIANLSRISTMSAVSARDTTQAQFLCESIMARLTSGIIDFESVFDEPVYDPVFDFDDVGTSYSNSSYNNGDHKWVYSVEINTLDDYGLLEVVVTVTQYLPHSSREPVSCKLVRWMLNKAMAAEMLESAAGSTDSESSGTSSNPSTSTPSGTASNASSNASTGSAPEGNTGGSMTGGTGGGNTGGGGGGNAGEGGR